MILALFGARTQRAEHAHESGIDDEAGRWSWRCWPSWQDTAAVGFAGLTGT
jgi:hypothetical protein